MKENKVRGQCNCGAVCFEVDSEISEVLMCHCSICRKASGANGVAVVLVNNDLFRWTQGEDQISNWKKPVGDWQAWFCKMCGSPLPGVNDDSHMFIPAGLIEEGGQPLKVTHHLWVDSKADWDEIGDAGKQHAEFFEG